MMNLAECDMKETERKVLFLSSTISTLLPLVHGMTAGAKPPSSAVNLPSAFVMNNGDTPAIFNFLDVSTAWVRDALIWGHGEHLQEL